MCVHKIWCWVQNLQIKLVFFSFDFFLFKRKLFVYLLVLLPVKTEKQ